MKRRTLLRQCLLTRSGRNSGRRSFVYTDPVLVAIVFSIFCFSNVPTVRGQGGTHRHIGFRSDNARLESVQRNRPLMRGGNGAALPARVSLRKYLPRVGDQGLHPTDAAWAVAYAGLTCVKAVGQSSSNAKLIDSMAFSPGFVTAIVTEEHRTSCEQGISLLDALEATLRVGAMPLRDFPYECQMDVPVWLKAKAGQNRISAFCKLFDPGDPDKHFALKRSLAEQNPVVAGLRYVESFLDGDEVWRPSPAELSSESGGNDTIIAVTVIGYDDTMLGGS